MSTAVPANTTNMGVRVLSLDGGGIGVLSELLILDRIMYRVQTELRRDTRPSPCEYFELIGGSGTGGLIALMLGRLRMSIADATAAYEKLRPQSKIGFADHFVCAMNALNMNASRGAAIECMMWEAARATSATPGLFKPMEIGLGGTKQRYIGGGVGNNNPAALVLAEAKKLYPLRPVVLLASIGSGHPDVIQIPKAPSTNAVGKVMKSITMDCEKTHEEMATLYRLLPNTYFRLNVQQGMQGLASHDWNESSAISAHTRAYLGTEDVKSKLTEAVKVILSS
ncbi:acyl transferase/acyl hydrolase/lysophospholipase [Mycena rosella]|uniref:Acyl transferase/acyl hydrolase/lysophospholipase n=1 Tax=Mycena rosella TaxID=1033263 RepID=A0AAD7CXL0_MYCRO|nr:acyl transferase/acyl hydrolase/lysophospholipase [Mycena rosella]